MSTVVPRRTLYVALDRPSKLVNLTSVSGFYIPDTPHRPFSFDKRRRLGVLVLYDFCPHGSEQQTFLLRFTSSHYQWKIITLNHVFLWIQLLCTPSQLYFVKDLSIFCRIISASLVSIREVRGRYRSQE